MASAAVARRPGSARAAQAAAKQRRKTILLVGLVVVLAGLLAYELPHMLKRSDGNSSSATSAASAPSSSAPAPRHDAKPLHGSRTGADPFAVKALPNRDARAAAAGGPDPFTAPAPPAPSPAVSAPAPPAAAASSALPKQIVIGRPGGDRVATHGWIVILASIPTRSGRDSAFRFARVAHARVGALSILNSSHRRPLRGGYWVVYSGPYSTLRAVSRQAGDIHAAGYRTAYIRELITYR
jgi:hypothetical protein